MPVYTTRIETPLGMMDARSADDGITHLSFTGDRHQLPGDLPPLTGSGAEILTEENRLLSELRLQIAGYFSRSATVFDIPLSLNGTPFQLQIWSLLTDIPIGKTVSYLELATAWGDPKAVRAVAAANAANPLAIVVPCHRVIGSDGRLTGYAGGLWRKQWLLDHEKDQLRLDLSEA